MNKPLALIIEDDDDLSEIYSVALRGSGFDTEIVRDGGSALQRLTGPIPAVIVLDLHLPRVAGPAILEQIRADARLARTAVIVTTADARLAEEMQVKADLVLLKPVSVNQLRELAQRMYHRGETA